MARGLQKQVVTVPISAGVNEEVDALLLEPPYASEAENAVFDKQGVISKRFGFSQMVATGYSTSDTPVSIHNAQGTLLLRTDAETYAYAPNNNRWAATPTQQPFPCSYTTRPWVRISGDVEDFGVAYANGRICTVWREANTQTCYYSLRDEEGGTITAPTVLTGAEANIKVTRTLDGTFCIFAVDDTNDDLLMWRITSAATTVGASSIIVAVVGTAYYIYADETVSNDIWISQDAGSPAFGLTRVNSAGTVVAQNSPIAAGSSLAGPVFWSATNSRLYMMRDDGVLIYTPAALTPITTGDTVTAPTGWSLGKAYIGEGSGTGLYVFADITFDTDIGGILPGLQSAYGLRWSSTDSAVAAVSLNTEYNLRITGEPFRAGGRTFVGLQHAVDPDIFNVNTGATSTSTTTSGVAPQNVQYLCTVEGANLVQSATYNVDRAKDPGTWVTNFPAVSSTERLHPTFSVLEAVLESSAVGNVHGGNLLRFDFAPTCLTSAPTGRGTYIAGGTLAGFDGEKVFEAAIPFRPSIVHVEHTAGIVDAPRDANWRVAVVLHWQDAAGCTHRLVSNTWEVEGTVDTNDDFDIYITRPPEVTCLTGVWSPRWDIYINNVDEGSDSPLRRHRANISLVNTGTNDNHIGVYNITQLERGTGAALFTESGELEPAPIPGASFVAAANDRLWIVPADDSTVAWPSKRLVPRFAPEFTENLATPVPGDAGPLVAVAALEDKVILLGENRVYFVAGEGPDNTGQGSFIGPEPLRYEDGCVDPSSVTNFSGGVVFRSNEGIMLIDPGLNVVKISGPVQDTLDGLTISRSLVVPHRGGILFACEGSTSLWWDYRSNAWSVWTGFELDDACVLDGFLYRVFDSGLLNVFKEAADYDDEALLKVRTPWLKVGGALEGLARVWWVKLSGTKYSGDLRVTLDFNGSTTNQQVVDVANADIPATLAVRVKPRIQKIRSLRVTVEQIIIDDGDPPQPGAAFTLSGITLELGTKGVSYIGAPTEKS